MPERREKTLGPNEGEMLVHIASSAFSRFNPEGVNPFHIKEALTPQLATPEVWDFHKTYFKEAGLPVENIPIVLLRAGSSEENPVDLNRIKISMSLTRGAWYNPQYLNLSSTQFVNSRLYDGTLRNNGDGTYSTYHEEGSLPLGPQKDGVHGIGIVVGEDRNSDKYRARLVPLTLPPNYKELLTNEPESTPETFFESSNQVIVDPERIKGLKQTIEEDGYQFAMNVFERFKQNNSLRWTGNKPGVYDFPILEGERRCGIQFSEKRITITIPGVGANEEGIVDNVALGRDGDLKVYLIPTEDNWAMAVGMKWRNQSKVDFGSVDESLQTPEFMAELLALVEHDIAIKQSHTTSFREKGQKNPPKPQNKPWNKRGENPHRYH